MTDVRKRIVIVGATSAIASHCARLWVKDANVDVTLVCRDKTKAEFVAADLRVRNPQAVIRVLQAEFIGADAIAKLVDSIVADIPAGEALSLVMLAHGSLPDQQRCQEDLSVAYGALAVNGISTALLSEAFVSHMQKANCGTLAIIGSVAGDRGRKSNYVYGAAKGLVDRYAQGLQHRLSNSNVSVVLIKPGPTDTPMTAHLKQRGDHLADVEKVAELIVKGIAQRKPVVYVPGKWALIMMIIRHLPRFVFNRLEI